MASGPSLQTIKTLFAKSSNRCAFPKCSVSIVQDDILLGHVCHIKGARPGSARYDASQDDSARHSEPNLIILCPNHHSVVDDDDEAYTTDRLYQMKATHESGHIHFQQGITNAAAKALVSGFSSSFGQIGGITSGTMHVETLNISNERRSPANKEKETNAVEKLWTVTTKMRQAFGDIWLAESILTAKEIDGYFQTCDWPGSLRSVMHYSSYDWAAQQLSQTGATNCDDCRLYVTDRLWTIFFTIRAFYGRLGVLYHKSFEQGSYHNWREDDVFASHAISLFGEALFQQAKIMSVHGLETILARADAEFLREARAIREAH